MNARFAMPAAASAAVLLAACAPAATGTPVAVSSTDTACVLSAESVPAGVVTFTVANDSSVETELYVLNLDDSIVSEVEHVGPGTSRDLTVTLAAGSYIIECEPEGSGGFEVGFTVTE